MSRVAYLLTTDPNSDRSQSARTVLDNVGFNTEFVMCIPHDDKVVSNKLSMLSIYEKIVNGPDQWAYVFEDDINILEPIKLEEIIQYEQLSAYAIILGCGVFTWITEVPYTLSTKINGHPVSLIKGNVRGLHAIGFSKIGARELLNFAKNFESWRYMDMIFEKFLELFPAPAVRYDLESYIKGNYGIFFQDRAQFPSLIG